MAIITTEKLDYAFSYNVKGYKQFSNHRANSRLFISLDIDTLIPFCKNIIVTGLNIKSVKNWWKTCVFLLFPREIFALLKIRLLFVQQINKPLFMRQSPRKKLKI